jgi:hypothetical protein
MARPDTLVVDGHGFNWQRLCELRREQLEAWRAVQAQQLALFEMQEDWRPKRERTASGRYEEPSLLSLIEPNTSDE